jgi:hypothetical protein
MQLYNADINILRDQNLEPNPLNGNAAEESVLLEYYSRNGIQDSEGGAVSWSASFCTVTQNFATGPDGTMTAFKVTEDTNNVYHDVHSAMVNTTNGTTNSFTVYAKAGTRTKMVFSTNVNASGVDHAIINLLDGSFIVAPSVIQVRVSDAGNGWWRIEGSFVYDNGTFQVSITLGLVNASNQIDYLGDGASYALFWRGCDWMNRLIPSSVLESITNQAGSAVPPGFPDTNPTEFNYGTGRYLDSPLQIPFIYPPQEMSGLLEFIERGTSLTTGAGLWSIGDYVLATPSLQIGLGTTGYQIKHISGGTVSSVLATKPTIGDIVRLRFSLNADGSVQIWQSINGAAETTPGASAANALGVAWSENYSWLNGLGAGNQGFVAFRQMVVLPGANISQADLLTHFT